jgi:hypothetical protein
MQRRFNEGRYWQRMQAGEFVEVIMDLSVPQAGILERHPDAESVKAHYRDHHGNDIVEVHYYRLPDGSVIPGKRPDPKLLFEDGVMYHQERAHQRAERLAREAEAKRLADEQTKNNSA